MGNKTAQCTGSDASDNDDESKLPSNNNNLFGICKSTKSCVALTRIIHALTIYDVYHNNHKKLSECFLKYKESISIINDYHHILNCHLNEDNMTKNQSNKSFELIYKEIMQKKLKCDINSCKIFLRNNRRREKERIDCENKNLAIYIDILDSIHCYFIHSIDIGYRIIHPISRSESKSKSKKKNDEYELYDAQIASLKSYLFKKRQHLEKIRGQNRVLQNKFMTEIAMTSNKTDSNFANEQKKESLENINFLSELTDKTLQRKDKIYSFGNRFPSISSRKKDMKYSSFKQEMIDNAICSIDVNTFDELYNQCEMLSINSSTIKKIQLNDIYNIMAVKLYTDFDTLSYVFSATFRPQNANECIIITTKRQLHYWWWGNALISTVKKFGTKIKHSNIKVFYHGVSKVYFNKFIARFNSPTSTTTQLQIAAIFAKNTGLILELKMYNGANSRNLPYFNCTFISSYAYEDERLFIATEGNLYLEFNSIRNLSTNENYKTFIDALAALDDIVDAVDRQISSKSSRKIVSLLQTLNGNNNTLPIYVLESLKKWQQERRSIHINLKQLNSSYTFLCEMFLSTKEKNLLSFKKINMMFKNVTDINCYATECLYEEHITALLSSLDDINKLKYSKLDEICLHDVTNISSLQYLVEQNESLFTKKNWKVEIDEIQDDVLKIHR